MTLISKLLPTANIVVDLDASSKKRVFEQAGLLFENNQQIARSQVFDSLFAREKLGSTGLGRGVAIPHGRIKGLKEAVGALVSYAFDTLGADVVRAYASADNIASVRVAEKVGMKLMERIEHRYGNETWYGVRYERRRGG